MLYLLKYSTALVAHYWPVTLTDKHRVLTFRQLYIFINVKTVLQLKLCTGACFIAGQESNHICGVNHCKANTHIICLLHTLRHPGGVKHGVTLFLYASAAVLNFAL